MLDSAVVSAFVHGIAAGLTLTTMLGVVRSGLRRDVKIAATLFSVSILAWMINESPPLWQVLGEPWPVAFAAFAVAGLFWLFVLVVFADYRVTPLTVAPALVLLVSGVVMFSVPPPIKEALWWLRNAFSGLLAIHAGVLIARGWADDLVEGRRRFRGLLLGLACLFAVLEVGVGFTFRLTHDPAWLQLVVGRTGGGLLLAVLTLSLAGLMLRPDPSVFGAPRRQEAPPDTRAQAADRLTLQRLDAMMGEGAWRREGLTIGALARDLGVPEHRLRKLINGRLGHRNFADFVNGYRIEAAKRRLADPAEARTTVAAIAFDLGFGSLGPFNRAFRAATGLTPTDWRREALASPELKEAV
ncbi:AraC family transcriptional regulator [Phenylobacterium sp. J367]|uniref:helix-turn-helix domain-containing protein n=1 Tax=Phenylobacterium sp. J367 TaxID=2898435 RepID=UPI0021511E91|nr:helix-turn-helix domain-containing protein [Phenylobacterium sp. J367]MCR5880788.1 helix-turn-helix domain-containing protein [Phenylobacterium sp. J367]